MTKSLSRRSGSVHNTDNFDFCDEVEDRVEEQYGLQDGGDLCFNLLESDVITRDMSIDEAARIVAMHIQQA